MAITLSKGGNISLSKTEPTLERILVGLGWRARETAGVAFDLDASAFMLAENGKVRCDEDVVFYNQLVSPCGAVQHTGDNRTGAGGGDDESLVIDLGRLPAAVARIVVCVTIHEAEARRQSFGQVADAFIRILDQDNDHEIARFDLSEDYGSETAMIFGEIYRYHGEWKFKAVGQGFAGGLEALCHRYGVVVV